MNPNDPEENPEAFQWMKESPEPNADYPPVQSPLHVKSNASSSSLEKQQIMGQSRPRPHRGNPSDPRQSGGWRNSPDHQQGGARRSITSESGSDGSNASHSLMQPGHRRERSDKKNNSSDGSYPVSPSRTSRPSLDTGHHRVGSVPKFGAWDESDPASGEGYTFIFEKMKKEKQSPAPPFSPVNPQASYYSNAQEKGRSSSRSKICCCLFSSGTD